MPVISSEIIQDDTLPDGSRVLNYSYQDHIGSPPHVIGSFRLLPPDAATFDANADMLSRIPMIEAMWADNEVQEGVGAVYEDGAPIDRVAQHQPQNDFDRKVLGQLMLLTDQEAGYFNRALEFFQAVEVRAGNPPNQRYTYLECTVDQYDEIEDRFNQHSGVRSFFVAEQSRYWEDLPPEFE